MIEQPLPEGAPPALVCELMFAAIYSVVSKIPTVVAKQLSATSYVVIDTQHKLSDPNTAADVIIDIRTVANPFLSTIAVRTIYPEYHR